LGSRNPFFPSSALFPWHSTGHVNIASCQLCFRFVVTSAPLVPFLSPLPSSRIVYDGRGRLGPAGSIRNTPSRAPDPGSLSFRRYRLTFALFPLFPGARESMPSLHFLEAQPPVLVSCITSSQISTASAIQPCLFLFASLGHRPVVGTHFSFRSVTGFPDAHLFPLS